MKKNNLIYALINLCLTLLCLWIFLLFAITSKNNTIEDLSKKIGKLEAEILKKDVYIQILQNEKSGIEKDIIFKDISTTFEDNSTTKTE